jgi:sulfatase modifying factor 1
VKAGFVVCVLALTVGCTKEAPSSGPTIASVARGESHTTHADRSRLARTLDEADEPRQATFIVGHFRDGCPANMASIGGRFCIDRYEAALVEILSNGEERPYDSFLPVEGHVVRAVSERGVVPHGYVSEVQAKDACARSGKRLCKAAEWRKACMGPRKTTFGYGNTRVAGRCNDHGVSPMISVMQLEVRRPWDWTHERMNDPRLNQAPNTLARTGAHASCTNEYGVYDMIGNLHEWVDDPEGTFQGGYYLDTHLNGDGCTYTTTAHGPRYHDYSTGFRCCADE